MVRVALVSDMHVDSTSTRFCENARVLHWIADDIRHRDVHAVAIAGDVFNCPPRPMPSPEDYAFTGDLFVSMARTGPVIGVLGNHDPEGALDIHNHIGRTDHPITIYDRPAVHRLHSAAIGCFPWPKKASAVACGLESRQHLSNLMLLLCQGLDEAGPGPRLFLGHLNLVGARVGTGQPLAPVNGIDVSTSDLALVRAHCFMLGHVHADQQIDVNGAPCIYPGSPSAHSYGEPGEHYYAVIEVDDDGTARVEMVPTPCRPMLLINVDFFDGQIVWRSPQPDSVREADIRLRYRVPREHAVAARAEIGRIKDLWLSDGAADVKLDEVLLVTTRARAPEVAREEALPGKLVAHWRGRGELPAPADLETILGPRLAEVEEAS